MHVHVHSMKAEKERVKGQVKSFSPSKKKMKVVSFMDFGKTKWHFNHIGYV